MKEKLFDSEAKVMEIIWEKSPISAKDISLIATDTIGWNKNTTYTVIKRLLERGVLKNEEGTVTSLISKEEAQASEIEELVEKKFEGSLPAFIAAFTARKTLSQEEIARRLNIPVGTVKSRLYYAKKHFKENYPYPPKAKGETVMKKMPEKMPEYTIKRLESVPFSVKHEELPGMFIVPRIGETCQFAMYDLPKGKRSGVYRLSVKGNVVIHDIQGVEIESEYTENGQYSVVPPSGFDGFSDVPSFPGCCSPVESPSFSGSLVSSGISLFSGC